MKITIQQARNSAPALREFSTMKVPAPVAMRAMLVLKALREPMESFDEAWNKLLKEVGKPIEGKDGQFEITDKERFEKEAKEMGEQEIDVPGDPIDVSRLGNMEVTPQMLLALDWLIKPDQVK